MFSNDLFKLERLKIEAYFDSKRSKKTGDDFEVMFNPESFKRKYQTIFNSGAAGRTVNYARSDPSDLQLNLIIDGTGVKEFGVTLLDGQKTVKERVDAFLAHCYNINSDSHEPSYLKIKWGDLNFWCRLKQVEINYIRFDRDGKALRAELDALFLSDEELETQIARDAPQSPDLTHTRVVTAGDTLPLMTRKIYGSPKYYLRVAQANGLDDFRNLKPGQTIVFPPLPKSVN